MMISPESYYEMNLKGKTAEQIMSAIRGLKNEIGHLKNVMEHPNYGWSLSIIGFENGIVIFFQTWRTYGKHKTIS